MAKRQLIVEIVGDEQSFLNSLRKSSRGAKQFGGDLEKVSRGALAASVSVRGLGRSLAFASTSFLGGAGIVFAFKSIVNEASRVQEETEKTGIVFGKNARDVQAWAGSLAQSFGVSEGAALEASGRFGNMLRPLGFAAPLAAQMSKRMVELAADMASFNNTKPDQVLAALAGGLAGQVRPLRQFGVFLSQARIQAEALADGIAKQGQKLTTAQKVQAAYNIILKDTRFQQGDVARNTESLSVAQSKLTAGVQNLEAGLGRTLLPTLTKYVNKAAEWLNQTQNQQRIQGIFQKAVNGTVTVIRSLVAAFKEILGTVRPLVDDLGGLKNVLVGLAAIKIASVAAGWTTSMVLLGAEAKKSEGKVNALRLSLLKLGAIGVIAIGVEVILNRDKIEGAVDNFLKSHSLGFLANKKIEIPASFTLRDAIRTRAQIAQMKGDGDLLVQAFDKLIAKMKQQRQEQRKTISEASADFARAAHDRAPLVEDTPVAQTQRGLTAKQRNSFFDAMIGRREDRVQDIKSLRGQLADLQTISELVQQRLTKTKDVTRRQQLQDELLDISRKQNDVREKLAQEFADGLSLKLAKAEATGGLNDDLKALEAINANIRRQIKETGTTAALQQQLFDNQQAIKDKRLEQASRQQFRALGLGPTGESLVPQRKRLQKELGTISQAVSGTFLDTTKTRGVLSNIRKVLGENVNGLRSDVRQAIQGMLSDIDKQLKDHGAKPTFKVMDTDKVLAGLGLSSEQLRAARGRLAQIGPGGRIPGGGIGAFGFQLQPSFAAVGFGGREGPFDVNVFLDSKPIEAKVTIRQQRRAGRGSGSRRGTIAGRRMGLG